MPVDAQKTNEIDRMEDGADAGHPATPADAVNDWYRRLGASHRRRDESAQLSARAIQERDNARQRACQSRWPAIVAAMRTLIGCYNEGAGSETLVLVDRATGEGGELTATVTARSGRTLVMAVDDADLWVRHSQDENGTTQSERWIGLNRTDEATAGYVLQNWLTQLDAHDGGDGLSPPEARLTGR